jgi:peptide-methionine (S)-S-oxide reductase
MKQGRLPVFLFVAAILMGLFLGLAGLRHRTAPPDPKSLTARGLARTQTAPKQIGETRVASFAAGCFWSVEEEFRREKGVVATAVGFSGGHIRNPTYEQVCYEDTGHAETVMVEYDPKVVSYERLLQLFWDLHDPTTPDRQGPDVGDQYRSVIFTHTPEQQAAALASRDKLQRSGELHAPIVTQIVPASDFFKAEEYHQQYVEKGGIAFCHRRK